MNWFQRLLGEKQTTTAKSPAAAERTALREGDTFLSTDDGDGYQVCRPLTEAQREQIDKSTILLRTGQLYMHYWTDNLVGTDRNDPEWQNKVMFFWKAEEPFPKKSLPPIFESFQSRYFLFAGDTAKISLQAAQVIPWFGMPGLGEKYVCELAGEKLTVPELHEAGLVEYVERVELTSQNSAILTERETYYFLLDERLITFRNGNFYLKDNPISIDKAYEIGGMHIIKKMKVE